MIEDVLNRKVLIEHKVPRTAAHCSSTGKEEVGVGTEGNTWLQARAARG